MALRHVCRGKQIVMDIAQALAYLHSNGMQDCCLFLSLMQALSLYCALPIPAETQISCLAAQCSELRQARRSQYQSGSVAIALFPVLEFHAHCASCSGNPVSARQEAATDRLLLRRNNSFGHQSMTLTSGVAHQPITAFGYKNVICLHCPIGLDSIRVVGSMCALTVMLLPQSSL